MMNKYCLRMRFLIFLTFTTISLSSCSDTSISPDKNNAQISYPEFFIEKGSDMDTSYISFRGVKKNNDTLEIQATSWGVIEYGLFLSRKNFIKEIQFQMMGKCGTVSTRTWTKVTLKGWIKSEETNTLQKLSFTNFNDTINVVKTTIN